MTTFGITPKQSEALAFIANYVCSRGYSPTCREIAGALEIKSSSRVVELIKSLVERGYLVRIEGKSRSLALTEAANSLIAKEVA